jgi:hypothetical protein
MSRWQTKPREYNIWCKFPSPELAGFDDTVDDIAVAQANVAREAGCSETVGRAIKV